jgi:hypothetical protein
MKCFYSGTEAVGICKFCGRGLALASATEFPQGLACRNRCEAEVKSGVALAEVDRKLTALSAAMLQRQNSTALVSAVFCMLAGAGFIYFTGFDDGLSLPSFMGAAFFLYGGYSLVRALRAK